MMKKLVMMMVLAATAIVSTAYAAGMQRSEWQAKVGEAAQKPDVLKKIMQDLDTTNKVAFLREINAAIEKMPGSDESKAAAFLAANTAAVESAGKADRLAVLSEVFATVPLESLTVINEEFGKTIFNRDAASAMTDAEYKDLARNAMGAISDRCATAESGPQREAFAILMFENATASSSDDFKRELADELVKSLPSDSQQTARETWIPQAQGWEQTKSYDALLADSSGSGTEPDHETTVSLVPISLPLAPQQGVEALLTDLVLEKTVDGGDVGQRIMTSYDPGLSQNPTITDPAPNSPDYKYRSTLPGSDPNDYQSTSRGKQEGKNGEAPGASDNGGSDNGGGSGSGSSSGSDVPIIPEPRPYAGQRTY